MICTGNGADHCCWIEGDVCPLLRDDGTDAARRWVCTALEQSGGSRPEANVGDMYRPIGERWLRLGLPFDLCWTFQPDPLKNHCCTVEVT